MELKRLLTADEENRAVSPVIGVILMVAITVILAAVIGTFVLGLGDQVQQTSPNAQWDWETDSSDQVILTHEGGDSVDATLLGLRGNGMSSTADDLSGTGPGFNEAELSAGSSMTIATGNLNGAGGEIRLIWQSEGSSSTLSTYDYSP
jgi:flagellin-like protein